jgi:hypothetical protein
MENEETDAEAVKRLEDEMEDTLHKMEDEEEELDEGTEKAKEDWEKARKDPSIPGAEPPEKDEES